MREQSASIDTAARSGVTGPPFNPRRTFDYLPDEILIVPQTDHFAIPPADLCGRLRRAVESAASKDASSMEKLKTAVCEYTDLLREQGSTPEGVLISLKAVMNIHGMSPRTPDPLDHGRYRIREQVSTWSIEQYFKDGACL